MLNCMAFELTQRRVLVKRFKFGTTKFCLPSSAFKYNLTTILLGNIPKRKVNIMLNCVFFVTSQKPQWNT